MDTSDDPTTVIRMQRDFDQFLSGSSRNRSGLKFDINRPVNEREDSCNSGSSSNLTVRSLFEKEKNAMLKEAEIKKAKSEITKLKTDLQSEQVSYKRARIEYEKDLVSLRDEKEREAEKIKEMKDKLSYMVEQETRFREEMLECRQELNERKIQFENKVLTLQNEKRQLQEDLQKAKDAAWEKSSELRKELFSLQTNHSATKNELDEVKAQFKLEQMKASERSSQMKETEEYKQRAVVAEKALKDLQMKISSMEEDAVVTKALRTQLSSVPSLEKEIARLKEDNAILREKQENNMLLKEQVEGLKQKLERSEQRNERIAFLEAENMELTSKLNKWQTVEVPGSNIRNPAQLSQRIAHLQESEAILLEKQGQLQSSYHSKEQDFKQLQLKYENLTAQLTTEKTRNMQHSQLVKKLQRKLLLVSKDRDSLKRLLDDYENEVTISIPSNFSSRIKQLEEVVESYRRQVESLEAELKSKEDNIDIRQTVQPLSNGEVSRSSEPKLDQKTILHLRERIATLEKELEKVQQENHVLEARIEQRHLQGDYDPSKTKVLHFSMNPAAIAQTQRSEELTKLREENERLKHRIKILEETGQSQDVTLQVEQKMQEPSSSKEVEEMKQQLEREELKNKRLVEAFKKTSQEFREVCYQLTGFKIDIPCANKYKITSMFAESPEDYFMFELSSNGEVQFLGTDFASKLQDHIDLYITKQNSIPAFLSAVTLDLFSQQTVNLG